MNNEHVENSPNTFKLTFAAYSRTIQCVLTPYTVIINSCELILPTSKISML